MPGPTGYLGEFLRTKNHSTIVGGFVSNAAAGTPIMRGASSYDIRITEGLIWNHAGTSVTMALYLVPIKTDGTQAANDAGAILLNVAAAYTYTTNTANKFLAQGEVFLLPAGYDLFAVAGTASALKTKFSGVSEL